MSELWKKVSDVHCNSIIISSIILIHINVYMFINV